MSAPTPQQLAAINARGNILVAAGAGTGKTSTVTSRCLDLILREKCSVEQILMVTFTEAAAAEMRERIRKELREASDVAAGILPAVEPGFQPGGKSAASSGSSEGSQVPNRFIANPDGRMPSSTAGETPAATWLAEQTALLDTAPISTLHSFCLELVRRNFHALGLDPQFSVLDEQQTKPLVHAVLDAIFDRHYSQTTAASLAVAELVRTYGGGRDEAIRELVIKIHQHAQTLAEPARWFTTQAALFDNTTPDTWRAVFVEAMLDWSRLWRGTLEELADQSANVAACTKALGSLPEHPTIEQAASVLAQVIAADEAKWEYGIKTKVRTPIVGFFTGAQFLRELARDDGAPLAEDWAWSRGRMLALLELGREFGDEFGKAKRELGGIDFADQEQFALRLLLDDSGQTTTIAKACRERFRFVFVDECQDINAAQDAIIQAVSREGADANRFLVGDVKQSIYRFRLANPRIFQGYQEHWLRGDPVATTREAQEVQLDFFGLPAPPSRGKKKSRPSPAAAVVPATVSNQALSLTENFRSREALLQFINPVFRALMRPVIGGLTYDAAAELQFGARDARAAQSIAARRGGPPNCDPQQWPDANDVTPRVELHILTKDTEVESEETFEGDTVRADLLDLQATEREALLVARRLKQLQASGHRVWQRERGGFVPVEYRDMVVLMRSPSGRAEVFAKAFHREGVPLHAGRAGFLEAQEVADVLNLLRLVDNPLQDLPLLTVLRSPFVGMSPEELVEVRLAERGELLWIALGKCREATNECSAGLAQKAGDFIAQYNRWRELIRHSSLTHCIETALTETHYEALLLAGERGPERVANLRRLVELARRFDPFQREGLFRFLQFITEQEEVEARHEPAELFHENSVRLMTIHASKGLEFPVVVLAGLGTRFNVRELGNDILLHEDLGLCPKVLAPESRIKFPSIVHWLAAQRERRALLGEELRLLYVAMTRARDTLILTGAASRKDEITRWEEATPISNHTLVKATGFLDWLRLWFTNEVKPLEWLNESEGANELLRWRFYGANDAALASALEQTAPDELECIPPTAEEVALIQERVRVSYAHTAATCEPAKSSVTAIRQRVADETDDESQTFFRPEDSGLKSKIIATNSTQLTAAETGTAHHTFLQFVALKCTATELDLRNEALRLEREGALHPEQVAALDFAALTVFWQSELGAQIRSQPEGAVNREMPFTARFQVAEVEALLHPNGSLNQTTLMTEDDFIIVQGVADLVVLLPEEIWLVDFKTDHLQPEALAARVQHYEPQLKLYALALGRIYGRTVTNCCLHFLSARETIYVWV